MVEPSRPEPFFCPQYRPTVGLIREWQELPKKGTNHVSTCSLHRFRAPCAPIRPPAFAQLRPAPCRPGHLPVRQPHAALCNVDVGSRRDGVGGRLRVHPHRVCHPHHRALAARRRARRPDEPPHHHGGARRNLSGDRTGVRAGLLRHGIQPRGNRRDAGDACRARRHGDADRAGCSPAAVPRARGGDDAPSDGGRQHGEPGRNPRAGAPRRRSVLARRRGAHDAHRRRGLRWWSASFSSTPRTDLGRSRPRRSTT